jgi:hypothetical protein
MPMAAILVAWFVGFGLMAQALKELALDANSFVKHIDEEKFCRALQALQNFKMPGGHHPRAHSIYTPLILAPKFRCFLTNTC